MRTLYWNGRLVTLDLKFPHADAMVVEAGRIIAVGARHQLSTLIGAGDRSVDLGGRTVLPGLIDAHVHFAWSSLNLIDVDLTDALSLQEALGTVRERAQSTQPGQWVRGHGFNANLWDRWPNRYDLDAVAPEHPVALTSKDGHSLWVNSVALQAAGITGATETPEGGQIWRGSSGEPTGVLQENAMSLVFGAMPPRTQDELERAMRLGQQLAHSVGVTGLHDMDGIDSFKALQGLRRRGELAVRVCKQIPEASLEAALAAGLTTGFGDEWLRLGSLKVFADGALGSQTAHMLAPYEGRPNYLGVATHSKEELADLIRRAVMADISVAIHAIGDAANRTVLDAFALHVTDSRAKGLRHRIEHAQLLSPQDLPRFATLDIIASVQPSHAPSDRYIADQHWGRRAKLAYAFKSLLQSGARLALGSDMPVEPMDPLAGIHAAVWRKRMDEPGSEPWYPAERLTVMEAIRGFTLGAAYASGEERLKGTLSPGKLADFVVLTHDILSGSEEALRQARPAATVVDGRLVYGDLG